MAGSTLCRSGRYIGQCARTYVALYATSWLLHHLEPLVCSMGACIQGSCIQCCFMCHRGLGNPGNKILDTRIHLGSSIFFAWPVLGCGKLIRDPPLQKAQTGLHGTANSAGVARAWRMQRLATRARFMCTSLLPSCAAPFIYNLNVL